MCEDLYVEEEEQAQRQREIVSKAVLRADATKHRRPWICSDYHAIDMTAAAVRCHWLCCQRGSGLPVF